MSRKKVDIEELPKWVSMSYKNRIPQRGYFKGKQEYLSRYGKYLHHAWGRYWRALKRKEFKDYFCFVMNMEGYEVITYEEEVHRKDYPFTGTLYEVKGCPQEYNSGFTGTKVDGTGGWVEQYPFYISWKELRKTQHH